MAKLLLSLLIVVALVAVCQISPSASASVPPASPRLRPQSTAYPSHIRIEHLSVSTHKDFVIATHSPHFSWQHHSADVGASAQDRGVNQSAYQLRVSPVKRLLRTGQRQTLWSYDTGRRVSQQNRHIQYEGPQLSSDTSYTWSPSHTQPLTSALHSPPSILHADVPSRLFPAVPS